MTTTGIAIIMILGITLAVLGLSKIARRQHSARKGRLSQRMDELADGLRLNLASREILNKSAMGIDSLRQTIIVVRENAEQSLEEFVIDMKTVSKCSLVKHFSPPNNVPAPGSPPMVTEIALCFEYPGATGPVSIPFYRAIDNSIFELAELEGRAGAWVVLLEKLIGRRNAGRSH